jgi:hypothetical protein
MMEGNFDFEVLGVGCGIWGFRGINAFNVYYLEQVQRLYNVKGNMQHMYKAVVVG